MGSKSSKNKLQDLVERELKRKKTSNLDYNASKPGNPKLGHRVYNSSVLITESKQFVYITDKTGILRAYEKGLKMRYISTTLEEDSKRVLVRIGDEEVSILMNLDSPSVLIHNILFTLELALDQTKSWYMIR